jgi:hypothetical protein
MGVHGRCNLNRADLKLQQHGLVIALKVVHLFAWLQFVYGIQNIVKQIIALFSDDQKSVPTATNIIGK